MCNFPRGHITATHTAGYIMVFVLTLTLHLRNCLSTISPINSILQFFQTQELRSGMASTLHFYYWMRDCVSSCMVKELLLVGWGAFILISSVFLLISYPHRFIHKKFSVGTQRVSEPPIYKSELHSCLVYSHLEQVLLPLFLSVTLFYMNHISGNHKRDKDKPSGGGTRETEARQVDL